MVLARQSVEEIASALSLPVSVISLFEDLYFDVRSRLSARDWVIMKAVGRRYVTASGDPDVKTIARLLAFLGGPLIVAEVLPRLLDGSALSSGPLDPDTTCGRRALQLRLIVQALTMPTDGKTAMGLFAVQAYLSSALEPEPNVLDWHGVPAAIVPDLPEGVFQKIAERAAVTVATSASCVGWYPGSVGFRGFHRHDEGCEDGEVTRCGEGAILAGGDPAV
jgi:hypothetical protein